MSFSLVVGGISAIAGLLGWSIIKEGIRAGVKFYSGPFSAIPKLIMWGFDAYKGVTSIPRRLIILLSKRVGKKLLVRSAYVIVSRAAKGMGWGIVKIAKEATSIGTCIFTSLLKGAGNQQGEGENERYGRVILDMGERTTPRVSGCGLRDVEIIENFYEDPPRKPPEEANFEDEGKIEERFFSENERFLIVSMDDERDEMDQIREFEQAIGGNMWDMYTMTPEEAQAQASSGTSGLSRFMEQHDSFTSIDDDGDDNGDDKTTDYYYYKESEEGEGEWDDGEVSSIILFD